jgi:hypothetical protein
MSKEKTQLERFTRKEWIELIMTATFAMFLPRLFPSGILADLILGAWLIAIIIF